MTTPDADELQRRFEERQKAVSADELRRRFEAQQEITPPPSTRPEPDASTGEGRVSPEELAERFIARQSAAPEGLVEGERGGPSLLERVGGVLKDLGIRGVEVPGVTPALRRGTDEVFQALEAFGEETFRGLTFQGPSGKGFNPAEIINQGSAALLERPLAAQIGIGLIDPAIGVSRIPGVLRSVTPVGPGLQNPVVRQLRRSQIPPSVRPSLLPPTRPSVSLAVREVVEEGTRAVDAAFPNTAGVLKPMSPEVEASIAKLTGLAEEARPAQQEALAVGLEKRSIERGRRVGDLRARERAFRSQGMSSQEANRRATAALRGELPGPEFTPLQFTPGEFDGLFNHVLNISALDEFQRINARVALEKILGGIPVAPAEKKLLSEIFGTPFADALSQPPSALKKGLDISLDALNLPRTILTSFDVSAPLRQGVVLLPDHPRRWSESVVSMMKAFAREGSAQVVDDGIRADPNFTRFTARHPRGSNSNLFIADITGRRGLGQQEELYMSRFANLIPGIKQSQRAYVTFLNKLRFDVMSDIVGTAEAAGTRVTSQDLDELALFLNRATGRGSLGKSLDNIAPALNVAMFAPKLLMSRLQLPLSVGSKSALVRKEASKTLLKFVGTGVGLLSLLSFSAGVKVETDPRSSDFGKIRIGNSSMDIWGGFQPIARYIAQLSTGKGKTIAGKNRGEIRDLNRFALNDWREPVFLRFIRSKLSPIGSAVADPTIGGGRNFVGDPVLGEEGDRLFGLPNSRFARVAFERMAPLFWQDVVDGIEDAGVIGALKAAPAALGAGVTTFDREGR